MPRPIAVHISTSALRHNLSKVQSTLQQQAQPLQRATPKVWAVIKANAYGHGIEPAVNGFELADGLAMLYLAESIQCLCS